MNDFVIFLNMYTLWNKEACNSLRDASQANCTKNKETIISENIKKWKLFKGALQITAT